MKTIRKSLFFATTALAAASLLSTAALAQDANGEATGRGVDEIVVTAQRQAQSVLDVPLSIQALSGDQLSNSGIRQMSDLQLTTPGFAPSNSSGYNQMFIRGVGNSIFVGADPSVATFIDDVPRVFGTLVNNFVDVERVEVIKGAPGALYGRNATGGAVNIITRQPDPETLSAKFRFSYGEKDTIQGSAFANIPLGERAAMTLAAEVRKHDHYIKNIVANGPVYTPDMFAVNDVAGPGTASFLGTPEQTAAVMNSALLSQSGYVNEDFWAVSGKVMVKPTDTLKITIAGDYSQKDDDNGNGVYNTTPDYAVGALSGFFKSIIGADTTPALSAFAVPVTEKFTTAQRAQGYVRLKDYGVSGTAVLELPGVDLTSITAFRKNKSRFLTELGATPFNFLAARVIIDKQTFYQELRAVSNIDGPLSYIAGASYLEAKFNGGLETTILDPVALFIPSGSGRYTVKNWSAYLQLGYDLTENLNLTVSGRYIHEKNNALSFNGITGSEDPFNLKEEKFLPSATLKYTLASGGNVYARWARGFKAGGIVPVVPVTIFPDPFTQGGVFKGETIDTFEAGIRTPLAGGRVQFTAAVFYNDYKNVQVAAHARPEFPLVSIAVVNAGSARTYGAEAGVTAKVADPLTVGASAGYLNAKYKDFKVLNNPVLEDFDLSGRRMINSPEWQLSFHADVDHPVSDDWRVVGNVLASYTSEILWQQAGNAFLPDSVGPSYWLVNARLGVKTTDDKWELAVFAKNLFDEGYTTFGNSSASYGTILIWGDPRIVGIEATANF
ncbi:MAG: TonB-dependent receptor [Novosphingobium sp.]|nr:TonB-dependent receptor [Novosphingobium sp.]